MKNIIITPAEERDMEQIYALYKEFAEYEQLEDYFSASPEDMKRLMFEDKLLCMMKAELEGEMVGFAAYYYQLVSFPARKVLYLEDIFVKEKARGQGIGNLFLKKLEELAKEKNCIKMMWKCLEGNQTSRSFYEHIGAKLDTEWVIYEKYFD